MPLRAKRRKRAKASCTWCKGRGWSVAHRSDTPPLAIEKCDQCSVFVDDDEAEQVALRVLDQLMGCKEGQRR